MNHCLLKKKENRLDLFIKGVKQYSGSYRKRTPSGRGKGVRNWNWPLMTMVLISGH